MAQQIKLIGRTTDFKGKTLWEIVGNLKNFGVGRIVYRNMFQRYPEPCYMKIIKVQAMPNEEVRKVKVTVEKVFRGRHYAKPIDIYSASYKTDYRLVPKRDEAKFCGLENHTKNATIKEEKILPRFMEFPPLLKHFIVKETGNPNPVMPIRMKLNKEKAYKIATENEQPNVEFVMGLGKPKSVSLDLYKFIEK